MNSRLTSPSSFTSTLSAISFFCGSDNSTNGNSKGANDLRVKRKCANHPCGMIQTNLIMKDLLLRNQ